MSTRDQVLDALLAKLQTITAFQTTSRRLQLWTEVAPADQPALFLTDHREGQNKRPRGTPRKLTVQCMAYIYFRAGDDPSVIPSSVLNTYLDSIDAALVADNMDGSCTLGGLVDHCWVEGETIKDPGDLDGQGLLMVPIFVLFP